MSTNGPMIKEGFETFKKAVMEEYPNSNGIVTKEQIVMWYFKNERIGIPNRKHLFENETCRVLVDGKLHLDLNKVDVTVPPVPPVPLKKGRVKKEAVVVNQGATTTVVEASVTPEVNADGTVTTPVATEPVAETVAVEKPKKEKKNKKEKKVSGHACYAVHEETATIKEFPMTMVSIENAVAQIKFLFNNQPGVYSVYVDKQHWNDVTIAEEKEVHVSEVEVTTVKTEEIVTTTVTTEEPKAVEQEQVEVKEELPVAA